MSDGEFAGRTVVVTGGGWNVGRAIAEAFAAHGANVVIAARNVDRLRETADAIEASGGVVRAIPTDVTVWSEVEALVNRTLDEFGGIDCFAAIAGGGCVHEPIDAMQPDAWDRVMRQNATATFYCLRALLPHYREKGRGEFIACSGGGAYYPLLGPHLNAYACAKAAICRFTDQMTAELWETDIRIHCLDPGLVWSPDTLAEIEAEEARTGERHPNRDVNRPPTDAAELALWLASEKSKPLRGRLVSVEDSWWRDSEQVKRVHETVHLYRMRRVEE